MGFEYRLFEVAVRLLKGVSGYFAMKKDDLLGVQLHQLDNRVKSKRKSDLEIFFFLVHSCLCFNPKQNIRCFYKFVTRNFYHI